MSALSRRLVSLSAVFVLAVLLIQLGSATTHGSRAKAAQTAAPTSAPTMAATEPAIDLGGGLRLESRQSTEEVEKPKLSIEIKQPVLAGAPDSQIAAFNKAADEIVKKAIDGFKATLLEIQGTGTPDNLPADLPISTIDVSYEAVTATNSLLSIRFGVGFYARGAAHPGGYFVTLNYEMKAGKVLTLADLFEPGATYLQVIADYCVKELKAKERLDFPEGAEPNEVNYRNWNITDGGLLISFDEYQVAPYVAGPQEVVVPYSALKSMIKVDGPLAQYTK